MDSNVGYARVYAFRRKEMIHGMLVFLFTLYFLFAVYIFWVAMVSFCTFWTAVYLALTWPFQSVFEMCMRHKRMKMNK